MVDYRKKISVLTPYVPGKPVEEVKLEYGLEKVVKLASNENPYGFSPLAKNAVIEGLSNGFLYPDGNCTELRNALSQKLGVTTNQIVFGCGADEVIAMVGKVFIGDDDECITGSVTFSQYMASTVSMGGKMVYAPMKNDGYDLDAIADKITDKTKVIFIANPNNPTGTIHTEAEQRKFLEKVPPNVFVVFDEAYAEFVDDKDYPNTLTFLKDYKNIMLIKTFSKVYGLASFRVGYGVTHPEIAELFEKVRPPFNVTSQGQNAALASLKDIEFLEKSVKSNKEVREYVCSELDKMGISYIPTQTNFVMADSRRDSRTLFVELMKRGFIVRPGAAFDMDTYLRITFGTMEEMKEFINVFKEILGN